MAEEEKETSYGDFQDETKDAYVDQLLNPDDDNPIYEEDILYYEVSFETANKMKVEGSSTNCTTRSRYIIPIPHPPGLKQKLPIPTIGQTTCTTVVPDVLARMVYMDVGRWGGSGNYKKDTKKHWKRHRDFGLVCGRTALLCRYDGKTTFNDKSLKKKVKNSAGYKKMKKLLEVLSQNSTLGAVTIVNGIVSGFAHADVPSWDEIHVFLGDIHVPVLTNTNRTYCGVQPTSGSKTVPLKGRIDVEQAKNLIKGHVLKSLVAHGGWIGKVIQAINWATFINKLYKSQSVKAFPSGILVTPKEADEWFDDYHGANNKKGADIFEQAGEDLTRWVNLLVAYQENRSDSPKLRFVQTGDMFDLWIGLKVGFKAFSEMSEFHNDAAAKKFIEWWMNESLNDPTNNQATHIKNLLEMDKQITQGDKINPVFLYGNHDNYLGTPAAPANFSRDPEYVSDTGLHAEHGHACDSFNQDEGPTDGWAVTQIAFLFPEIRTLEDRATAYLGMLPGGTAPRLKAMEHALNRCVFHRVFDKGGRKNPKLMFVQGHSHRPMLREIWVVPKERVKKDSSTNINF